MEQYDEDKYIDWAGNIPRNWKISKIGGLYSFKNIKVSDEDYPPLSVTKNGILPQLENAAKSDAHDDRKLVNKGDFVINSRSDRRGSCGISSFDGSVSLINIVLNPKISLNSEYYNWLFHTELFADEFYKWGNGIVDDLWSTKWQNMKNIKIPVPPIDEQKSIAEFLNKKCNIINSSINDEIMFIEKYNEYKHSLITEVVTKGLNSNVPMKDSGIEWIGEIPKHWSISKIKYHSNLNSGKEIINELNYDDDVINVYGSGGLFKYTDTYLYDGESVLFGRKGTLGKPIFLNKKFWVVDTAYYLTFKNSKLCPKFCYYHLIFYPWDKITTKTAKPSIVGNDVINSFFAFPPINEQKEIIEYLDKKCNLIDSLISQKEKLIEKLEEYKNSLIFEYVTGKKRFKNDV